MSITSWPSAHCKQLIPCVGLYTVAYRGGGAGGHGSRAQALEGAPAQLVGVNFNLAKVA